MAITEYYVRADAAGGGDGTTDAASGANGAFTWGELKTRMEGGAAAAGDRYNIKAGSYSVSATDTWTNDGTPASPIIFRGFNSTIGDLDTVGRTSGTGALNTTNYPVITYTQTNRMNAAGSTNLVFMNMKFAVAGTGVSNPVVTTSGSSLCYQCFASNPSTNASAGGLNTVIAVLCDAELTGASGGACAIQVSQTAIGCRVALSQADGIRNASSTGVAIGNVVANCTGDGIKFTSTSTSATVCAYGNTVSHCGANAISIASAAFTNVALTALSNHVTDSGANHFYSNYDGTAQVMGFFAYNRTRDATTAVINGFDDSATASTLAHVTTDLDDAGDFTSYAGGDFTLISTAPGKGLGLPPYADIGGLQRQETSGGGGYVIGG